MEAGQWCPLGNRSLPPFLAKILLGLSVGITCGNNRPESCEEICDPDVEDKVYANLTHCDGT